MKKILLALVLVTISISAIAQINISGQLKSKKDSTALDLVTIRLLRANDSTYVSGATTNENGKFLIEGINAGKYLMTCSFLGYNTLYKNVSVADKNVNLGTLAMSENSVLLKEQVVLGKKAEIIVKEDTIEYNADSYKTQPNAVVEDLLKRLPGVEVSSDGTIKAQGKTVKKILVDGKEFFNQDTKMASKNIPVDIVDKVQVVDKKSDLAKLTGVDDGEDETVINLSIKEGMNNGWFGMVSGGLGTIPSGLSGLRYMGSAMINRFWNGNQISIIAGGNNTNDSGFMSGNSGRFSQFGGGSGITESQNVGINFNVGNEEKFRVGGDLTYMHSDAITKQKSDREYMFSDSSSYYNSSSHLRDVGNNVRGNFRMRWEVDSFSTLEFRPTFSVNFNKSDRNSESNTLAGDALRSLVTNSTNNGHSDGNNYDFSGELVYNYKFRNHPGRSISMQATYRASNTKEKTSSYSKNIFYMLNDSTNILDQYADNHQWTNNVSARATWTEPLGDVKNARFLTFAYQMQYNFNNADKYVYDNIYDDFGNWIGQELNNTTSNSFRNDNFTQNIQLGYKQVRKNYNTNIGLSVIPSMSRSINLINEDKTIPTRWVWNVAPFVRYKYRVNKTRSIDINYRGRSSQASLTQLQPVADISDPQRIVQGNPSLKPSFSNNLNVRFNDFNAESQRSMMGMLGVSYNNNSIVSATMYNQKTGGQWTTYDNVNGVWSGNAMFMVSLPFSDKRWQFNTNTSVSYNRNVGLTILNTEMPESLADVLMQKNNSNNMMAHESLGLAFRTGMLSIELRPFYGFQFSNNSLQTNTTQRVHTYGSTANIYYYTPWDIAISSDITYNGSKGYSNGYDLNQWLWNANISYSFLQGKTMTVMAQANDILRNTVNRSRSVASNYIQDTEYNTLTSYVMFSISYRFNTFGDKKPTIKGENRRGRNRGYDGEGDRMSRPMYGGGRGRM